MTYSISAWILPTIFFINLIFQQVINEISDAVVLAYDLEEPRFFDTNCAVI